MQEREVFMDAWIDSGEIKQIIIVTDGKSGSGISLVEAAKEAYDKGIVVSAIGIVDPEAGSEREAEETKKIAEAGGGLWYYSKAEDLKYAVKEIAIDTSVKTIERIVDRQLKVIIGEGIPDLEPESRTKIMNFIKKYGGNINLKCIVVIDAVRSIKGSFSIVEKSAAGLLESIRIRKGSSSIAVIDCSGETAGMHNTICEFAGDISLLNQNPELICRSGGGQAGAAILKACELMNQYYEVYNA